MSAPEDRADLERYALDHGWTVEHHGDTDAYIRPGVTVAVHFSSRGHACGGDLHDTPVHAGDDVADWARYILRERGEQPRPAADIRARYIEVLAQALAQTDPCRCEPSMLTGEASRLADALAAAGLLPTGQEWGARVLSGPHAGKVIVAGESETAVRAHAAGARNAEIVHHYTHDWREAPDV